MDAQALADQLAELRGQLLALECTVNALVLRLPNDAAQVLDALHATESFAYARSLAASESTKLALVSFDRQTRRMRDLIDRSEKPHPMDGVASDWSEL